jgi:aerobic-type carbon monoxide dehydrogenase small subunit (CoxS/CutS family)
MIEITVNGVDHRIDADPTTPLLYVLQDGLGLHAAKFGCGLGQCGACTVLVDDLPVFSCIVPAAALAGQAITTVEGLGTAAQPGDVQRAFLHEQAAQCGYCIPGMIARAEALLRRTTTPSEDEMRDAMAPSLCRCGTHMRILRAVRRAAAMRGGGVVDPAEPVT